MPVSNEKLNALFAIPSKIAIVTGAASGIGKATAHLFAHAGAKLVIADIDIKAAQNVASDIITAGGEALAVAVDISEETQVQRLFKRLFDAYGGIDILVNNAAYRPKADFLEMSVETWDRMHDVNTRGTFLCMREAIKLMRIQGADRGGAIVNISTIGAAHPTIFNNTHYDSSKSAVNGMTRTAAAEFAGDGIRINAIMPGGVHTEGTMKMQDGNAVSTPKGPIMMPGRMLLGMASPLQLASAILFLASPASSFMTGHIMAVDGGYLVG
ncbi:MAG: SDR family NAD(P)-dependent oxidoreductase [Acidocella sp.]|nr:SDR family NAD(P)-dependent oxidoreductase [Acidocella sp.]